MTSGHHNAQIRWGIGDMALASAISLGAFGLFFVAMAGMRLANQWNENPTSLAWFAALAESVLLLAVWLVAIKKYRLPWSAVGIRLPANGRSFALAAAALLGSLAFTSAYVLMVSSLELDALTPKPLPLELAGDGLVMLVSALALGGWVPLVEEIFFRGFLFAGIVAKFGLWVGAVVSAILFALVHFSVATIIPIFVTGTLFALVYYSTKSIWIPVFAHSAQNLLALFASRYVTPELGSGIGDGLRII